VASLPLLGAVIAFGSRMSEQIYARLCSWVLLLTLREAIASHAVGFEVSFLSHWRKLMPKTLFKVDLTKPMDQQELPGHNRWHPDIPAVVSVNPGDVFRIECKDWTDGQIKDNDSPDDIRDVDLTVVHVLSGPIWVNGAEPGDILVVDLLDIGALQGDEWGFTGIFAKNNGGGFLTDHFPTAAKAIWDFQGIYTSSRHIPGVRFAGITHPGLIGCAPSHELLATWNKRERELVQTAPDLRTYGAGLSGDTPVLAALPNPQNAILGTLPQSDYDRVAAEAARTVPPREHGGNCDIKNLSRGTRIYFPVYVEGAKLSMGDIHFSQGDGEISFCGAIEMSGSICTSISSKAAWTSTAWSTPSSNLVQSSRAIPNIWCLKEFLSMNSPASSTTWMCTSPIAAPA
jgi:formamidase